METVTALEEEFLRTRDFKSRLRLYARAAAIYPFENWQVKQIRCNLEVYRYEEAMEIYNDTMELYARELGSPPTAEMQECFERIELMDESHRKNTGDAGGWKKLDKLFLGRKEDIKRNIFGEDNVKGAYYCTYPSFVDYCRLVARAKSRSQFDAVLMFLTLSQKERGGLKQLDMQGQMHLLKGVIGSCLRIGDAYTRYGNRHYNNPAVCGYVRIHNHFLWMKSSNDLLPWKGDCVFLCQYSREVNQKLLFFVNNIRF